MSTEENTLLAKWMAGEITSAELQVLQKEVDLTKLENVLKQQKKFDIDVKSDDAMWQEFQSQLPKESAKLKSGPSYIKVLLIIGLLILIGAIVWISFFHSNQTEVKTQPAKTEIIQYADGTRIHISPKSSIAYIEKTWDQNRIVNLSGQAFFKVEKGSPFVVNTVQGKIEVLGTSFDIWEMEGTMRIQCFEGKVQVTIGRSSKIIFANQQLFIRNNKIGDVEELLTSQPDWMDQRRIYQKMSLRVVLQDIERFYGVKTDATNVKVTDNFGGIIPTNDLDKALEYLSKSVNWTYEIKENTIYFNPQ